MTTFLDMYQLAMCALRQWIWKHISQEEVQGFSPKKKGGVLYNYMFHTLSAS